MKTAIATVCLSGALDEKLEAIAQAGFKRVEIFENDLLSFNGSPADVGRMIADAGLSAITFQPFRDFEGMPDGKRERALLRAERKFDVMEALGCDLLRSAPTSPPTAWAASSRRGRPARARQTGPAGHAHAFQARKGRTSMTTARLGEVRRADSSGGRPEYSTASYPGAQHRPFAIRSIRATAFSW